jgi:hypothetical protein
MLRRGSWFLAWVRRALLSTAVVVALSVAAGTGAPRAAGSSSGTELVVVVGAGSPLHDISRSTLRRAYLGEVTEDHGARLVPLNQPPGAIARVAFDRALLGLEPDAIARFWIDQRIRGQGSAPRAIPTVPLLLRVLAQLPGGISYLRRADLPANATAVKVITVDGKKPGDTGYLFP